MRKGSLRRSFGNRVSIAGGLAQRFKTGGSVTKGTPFALVWGMSAPGERSPLAPGKEAIEMVEGSILEKDHDDVIDRNGFWSPDLPGRSRNRYRSRRHPGPDAAGEHDPVARRGSRSDRDVGSQPRRRDRLRS